MKRLFQLTTGHNDINLSRIINVTKFRISQFEYSGSDQTVHVCVNNFAKNYDETNEIFYTLFFYCRTSSSVTYTPQTDTEGWFPSYNLHNLNIIICQNGIAATTLSNCFIELEFI